MHYGFGKASTWKPQSRRQALQGFIEELWAVLDEQAACHDNLSDIVCDIEAEVKALIER